MSDLEKLAPGDYVLLMWPKNSEWRAYRIRSVLGADSAKSVRGELEYQPSDGAWKEISAIIRLGGDVTIRKYTPNQEGGAPDDLVELLKKLTEAMLTMRADQKRIRSRYIVHVALLLAPPL